MTLRQYLILMSFGTIFCWAAWGFTLFSVDPFHAGILEFLFFYVSLFLAMLGTFSTLGFWAKSKMINNDEIIFRHVKRTFRQGTMAATYLLLNLFFLQTKILTWWNGILILLFFAALEGIVFTNRKHSNQVFIP